MGWELNNNKKINKLKTMNKLERYLDAAMTIITYLAAAGGFYWIFVRFIITYLKTL